MSRPLGVRGTLALVAVLAAGCQDYNFNPVGHCVIQPGSERVTLSSVSTADVLFVVDDSGSMGAEQDALATNFSAFIDNLDQANATRVANGLDPFDFHIAVTSTSVFWNYQTSATCSSTCVDAPGQTVCCNANGTAARQPRDCSAGQACPGGTTCGTNCAGLKGSPYCCDQSTGSFPAGSLVDPISCTRVGAQCGTFERHYNFPGGCVQGVAANGWPYPDGDFVSWTSGTTLANPRVLHFDKELYTGGANRQGFTRSDLVGFFAGNGSTIQGNVKTGTCGSGEEQGFNAARRALEKALAKQQKDTYSIAPGKVLAWNGTTRVASADAEWPHDNAKLVLVFVGDEDDCSSPRDPAAGIVMQGTDVPGADACTRYSATAAPDGHKLYDVVTQFVDYFTGLGRPLGAAFIESASQTSCSGDQCTPGTCCQVDCPTTGVCGHDSSCGGQAAANRFFLAAGTLRGRGVDVVEGSICDPNFGNLLSQIAEIVKPPSGLTLPTQPAESAITLLRIADTAGKTRKVCGRPLAAGSYANLAAVQATGADWWFTATKDVTGSVGAWNPVAVSQFVYINPLGKCIANPGETYSADYLGQLPAGGCRSDADCAQKLGGAASAWTCYAGTQSSGACVDPATSAQPGTCLCGDHAKVCPGG
jgi:hypothetical protein